MAIVKPFKAIRPIPELAKQVASFPYDVITSDEAREMAKDNPYSFLHVDKAEIDLNPAIDVPDKRVYAKARDNLNQMIADGILVQDPGSYLYIYREMMGEKRQVGLVGCTHIDDYVTGVIKTHEQTRPTQEQERTDYIDYCDANTGLVFLAYRPQQAISRILETWIEAHTPVYDFSSDDRIRHTVWVIDNGATIHTLITLFNAVHPLYVADGHHRSAAAVNIGTRRRKQNPGYTGDEEFNYFLSALFPGDQLAILAYNRVVKDLHGLSVEEFLEKVSERFDIELSQGQGQYKPTQRHTFGMYVEGKWYKLTSKAETYNETDPVERLDASILQSNLLMPVLGIRDPQTDDRIDFVGGIRGLQELERRVARGMKVAFSMYPTSIDEMMAVADAGKLMPPKSTWFEPKLRSGLFVHKL
jgi:uncharacterized protein (DUF1015 family)